MRPRPISPYGITKLACEQLLSAYGKEVSMLEAIDTLAQVSRRRLEVVRARRREGDQTRTLADTARIRAVTGWEPTTAFAEGLAAQWCWAADRVAAR